MGRNDEIDRQFQPSLGVRQRGIARRRRVLVQHDADHLGAKAELLQQLDESGSANQRRHDVFQHHIRAAAEIQGRHHDAVQHRKRVDDHDVVRASRERQQLRDERGVDLRRLSGRGGRRHEVESAVVRRGELPQQRFVQPIALPQRVMQRRGGTQIEQHRAHAHLQRTVD